MYDMPDTSCRLRFRRCRVRIRKFVRLQKSKFHQSSYSSSDTERAGPSNPMIPRSSGTDGVPLFLVKSMSAEIEDSDELYRVSFSSGESRSSSRSSNFRANNGGPIGIGRVDSVRSQDGLVTTRVGSRPQTEPPIPGTAPSMLSDPTNSRPGTACSTRPQTSNSEEMPSITRVKSDIERLMKVVDPTKQQKLRLLSLDGGGIRGLSGLYILRNIMQELDQIVDKSVKRPLRPCDYFDLIGGTSTGGLMAVMLGILEMDVDSCIEEYLKLSPQIFPVKNFIAGSKFGKGIKVLSGSTIFDAASLEAAIKKLIVKWLGNRATNGEETPLLFEANNEPKCRVFVTATNYDTSKHLRLRNFGHATDLTGSCTIWQACRATSAAPTFFKPIRLHDSKVKLVDGGLGYNNPIRAVTNEAWEIWRGTREIGCIISLGTGVLPQYSVGGSGELGKLATYFLKSGTDAEKTAIEIKRELAEKFHGRDQVYWRFNVTTGVGHILLDEWQQSDNIKIATEKYLTQTTLAVKHCAWRLQRSSPV